MANQPNDYGNAYGYPQYGQQQPWGPYGFAPVDRGFAYTPRPQPKNVQPLTQDQIQKLRQGSNGFDWKVSEEDILRAICTHREKNGVAALTEVGEDVWHCSICGATFKSTSKNLDEVTAATNTIIDFLQTAKSMYLDAPDNLISQYFQIIPILEKLPVLYRKAVDNYNYYEGCPTGTIPISGMNYQSGFQTLDSMLAYNPMAQYGAPGQPMGYNPNMFQQRYYNGYPVGGYVPPQAGGQVPPAPWDMNQYNGYGQQPNGYPNDMGGPNPFMYNGGQQAPAPGVMPPVQQNNVQAQQQNNVPPQSAPPIQQNQGEITQQKSFNV